jgi:hypothetical protein
MAYSNLKFELIPTGEQSGQWGNTTNTNIGTAIEQAIVGMATLTSADFSSNVATLTLIDVNTAQNARALCLNIAAGAVAAAGTINVPAIQKPYLIINGSSFAVTVKVSGQTGVSVPAGKRTVVYNNATDVGNQIDYLSTLALGTALPITSGGTGSTSTTFVNLATNVTGVLPIANGGTGSSSTTFVNLATNVSGTLPVGNGGNGLSSTPANGQIDIGNGTGFTRATLTAGSNITITNTAGSISIASSNPGGTVTSVTGTAPVASSGGTTPAISLAVAYGDTLNPYASKTAKYVLAAPNAADGVPAFRALAASDIPTLNQNTTGTAGGLSATLAVASGGTGVTTSTGSGSVVLSTSPTLVTPALGTPSSGSLINCTFPTLNQNTTGTAAGLSSTLAIGSGGTGSTSTTYCSLTTNVSGTLPIGNGGSGQTTAQAAMNAFAGAVTSGSYLRGNGTNVVMASILAGDVPTLNQNTTGTAGGLSTTLAISSGGTGGTTAAAARTNLGATTVGGNMYTLANPSAVTFPRFNADNTVSALNAADFRTAIGAGSGGGSVTSVSGTGTVNGLTLTGTVTTSGDLTLGGTLSGIANSALTNSSITIGGTAIALGGSSNAITNDITISGATAGRGNSSTATNTAFGYRVLNNALAGQQSNNTGFGYDALRLVSTTSDNTAFGVYALTANNSGGSNTAVGSEAMKASTSGSDNVMVGYRAGYGLTTSGSNTGVGYGVFSVNNSVSGDNSAFGRTALRNVSGSSNTAAGSSAGSLLTSGNGNSFFGVNAGNQITTGSYNVLLGSFNGYNPSGLDLRAANNYVVLSDGQGNVRFYVTDTNTVAAQGAYDTTTASAANLFVNTLGYLLRSTSALKYKQDVRDLEDMDISLLRPVRYKSKCEGDDQTKDHLGLVADEAAEAGFNDLVTRGKNNEIEGFQYERLTVVLLKKLQTQQAQIEALTARLNVANL